MIEDRKVEYIANFNAEQKMRLSYKKYEPKILRKSVQKPLSYAHDRKKCHIQAPLPKLPPIPV